MNRDLVKKYIEIQPKKVVKNFDLGACKIEYEGIGQNREVKKINGDEEVCRAFLITRLVNELGYDAGRIEIEKEYTAGRAPRLNPRIDIIVRDKGGNAFLFIEAKSPSEYATIDKDKTINEQLYKVAALEKASGRLVKYLVLYTTANNLSDVKDDCIIIDMEKYPTFEEYENGRDYTNEIPARYGKAQHKPYIKDSDKDLETNFTGDMLNQLQIDLHNVLWGGGGTDDNEVFASLTNLILAKIQDEDTIESGEIYKFQSLSYENENNEEFETNEELFERINTLYRDALKSKLYILDEDELQKSYVVDTKKFSLFKLKYAVQKLEGLSFVDGKNSLNGKDILGDFFECIIRDGFKQNKGQFFTHINIVRFMLWAIQADKLAISRIKKDKEIPYMIDPSAGSGTFLIEYMKFITENMKYRFRDDLGTARAVKDKIESDWFYPDNRENKWAQTYIYASEVNFNLGTATKVNMILHGDGSTNVFVKDGLLPFDKYEKETAPNILHDSQEDALYADKAVNGNFDIILTNPPFSVDLDNETKRTLKKSFIYGNKKNSENLFVERWYQLLRENGRVAAVLPENVFDTSDNKYIRMFLYKYFKIKGVVSLPQLTFEPYTSTKTSILFAQKKTANEVNIWNAAWSKYSNQYSKLKTRVENLMAVFNGKKQKSKLPSIKDLTEEEKKILTEMLYAFVDKEDSSLSKNELIEKYLEELNELCTFDKDTADIVGYVNTWWVFGKVSTELSYEIFMAEADNIGYKRTKRGEKETKNDLYVLEYAPDIIDSEFILDNYQKQIDEISKDLKKVSNSLEKELKESRKEELEKKRGSLTTKLNDIISESVRIKAFLDKYYVNGKLKDEFSERTDSELIKEFKSGKLTDYCSYRVALHSVTCTCILDYMRKIEWD